MVTNFKGGTDKGLGVVVWILRRVWEKEVKRMATEGRSLGKRLREGRSGRKGLRGAVLVEGKEIMSSPEQTRRKEKDGKKRKVLYLGGRGRTQGKHQPNWGGRFVGDSKFITVKATTRTGHSHSGRGKKNQKLEGRIPQ